jgi:hypothetical protein
MSRKKKEAIRQALLNTNSQLRFLMVMDRVISKRYILYKKAHLERKRRFRLKQKQKGIQFNENILTSFRCSSCSKLTHVFHRFWGEILCTLCFFNPSVIRSVLKQTEELVVQDSPECIKDLLIMAQSALTKTQRAKQCRFICAMDYQKKSLKVSIEQFVIKCPKSFQFIFNSEEVGGEG